MNWQKMNTLNEKYTKKDTLLLVYIFCVLLRNALKPFSVLIKSWHGSCFYINVPIDGYTHRK